MTTLIGQTIGRTRSLKRSGAAAGDPACLFRIDKTPLSD
jgi:hypothetical protein